MPLVTSIISTDSDDIVGAVVDGGLFPLAYGSYSHQTTSSGDPFVSLDYGDLPKDLKEDIQSEQLKLTASFDLATTNFLSSEVDFALVTSNFRDNFLIQTEILTQIRSKT